MRGKCLCGAIEFEIEDDLPNLYQCHCSLCRKVTGSSANAALRITAAQFEWISGCDRVREFTTDSGFKSHFCDTCGSPVPNLTSNDSAYWIPAGLLEEGGELALGAHLYLASRASWDVVAEVGEQFDEMPAVEALDELLKRSKSVT